MRVVSRFLTVFILLLFVQCKNEKQSKNNNNLTNVVQYANGFSIENYDGYSILSVSNPWPNASKKYKYILKKQNGIIPDSLKQNPIISIPIKNIIVTSTTHIPSLEMLGEERKLIGFPNLNYISSDKTRALIDQKKITDIGKNESLNIEKIIDLQPDVIVGFGIDNNNPALDNLEKSGLKVVLNGDWNEQTPLGKAEWIKFFGCLFDKQKQADSIFKNIEKNYLQTLEIAKKAATSPTVLAGDIFEGKWYLPKGTSWGSLLIKEANANYLWQQTSGTGSLSLSFEEVFEKANNADFWITSGQFSSLSEMQNANPHYKEFAAFKNKCVYSFTRKKGKNGGVLYYELAPNRPDLVMKDLVKIFHPELLVDYKLFFFEKLE